MSSMFNRPMKARLKPPYCHLTPPAGPFDPTWPPRTGTGLCNWSNPLPPELPRNFGGLAEFTYLPYSQTYVAQIRQPPLLIRLECFYLPSPPTFTWHARYYMYGWFAGDAFSQPQPTRPGHPIHITDTLTHPGDPPPTITFSLDAFTLM